MDLLRKSNSEEFVLTRVAREAFVRLKDSFLDTPMLMHFDPMKWIVVVTDVSEYAIVVILMQPGEDLVMHCPEVWHLVAFHSQKICGVELNYPMHDKEFLAIMSAFH